MYKRLIARLLILCGCILGTLVLAQPASADACTTQCFADYRSCISFGVAGCDAVLSDCVCSCRGTC